MPINGSTYFGLDLGTTKICGLVGRVSGRYCECLAAAMVPSDGLKHGMVADIGVTAEGIREVVGRLERTVGVELGPAWVGVTGAQIASVTVRGAVAVARPQKAVTFEDVERALARADREVVMPPDREIVHSLPRLFRLDALEGVSNPVGMAGHRLEVETHIVTAATAALQNVERALEQAQVPVADIVAEPIATGHAVLTPDEKDLGAAVLDIGGGTTDIAVFEQGTACFTAALPIAGRTITRDLAIGLRIPMEEAERIKIAHGAARVAGTAPDEVVQVRTAGTDEPRAVPRREVAAVIQARVEELLEVAAQRLREGMPRPRFPAGVVLTGGTALLPGILELAEAQFGLPARLGAPHAAGPFGAAVDTPVYATAVGLVAFADRTDGRAREQQTHGVEHAWRTVREWWRSLVPWGS